MFQIYGIAVMFCLQPWKGFENVKKTKRLNQEEIKKELVNSLVNKKEVETEELNEQAGIVDNPEDAADLIKKYEEILKTERQGIISVAYHQGKVFSWFREKEKFVRLVANFGVRKGTIIFKINLFRVLAEYPKLKKSSVTLSSMKNYFQDIKKFAKRQASLNR